MNAISPGSTTIGYRQLPIATRQQLCGSMGRVFIISIILSITAALAACRGGNTGAPPNGDTTAILLFNGKGVSPNDVTAIQTILENNHLSYTTINGAALNTITQPQLLKHRLLIMPGGNFIDMGKSLDTATATNIRLAVQHGLNYLGICAGAFLAGNSAYYNGFNLTHGTTFHFYSVANQGIQKTAVAITSPGTPPIDQYWENGPQLSGWGSVVAKYPDGTPAVAQGKLGNGYIILSGIHAEAPEYWRRGINFKTPSDTCNAYAALLINAALNGRVLPHY